MPQDSLGRGIHQLYDGQRRRYFPLPDYDLTEPHAVKLTIHGRVIDEAFSQVLMEKTELPLADVLALDRVQKGLGIPDDVAARLRRMKLIEGRKPKYHVSAAVADVAAKRAEYIRTRPQSDVFYARLITDYLETFKQATRSDIDSLLMTKLSDVLDDKQKRSKIGNLLTKLRKQGIIANTGTPQAPVWQIAPGKSDAE